MQRQPLELLFEQALQLDLSSLFALCQSNQYFTDVLCNNEEFWKSKFQRDRSQQIQNYTGSWKELYLNYNHVFICGQLAPNFAVLDTPFKLGKRALQIALGGSHLLIMDPAHHVWSLGQNEHGQLGLKVDYLYKPSMISQTAFSHLDFEPHTFQALQIAAGTWTSYALDERYTMWAWGNNVNDTLGLGSGSQPIIPLPKSGLTFKAQRIAAGLKHVLFIDLDQNVLGAGANYFNQLGVNLGVVISPAPIGIRATQIAAAFNTSAAIDLEGILWVWGDSSRGQLGIGENRIIQRPLNTGMRVKDISLGGTHALLIDTDNQVWVTGSNQSGQLGLGPTIKTVNTWTPLGIAARQVSAGRTHSVLIDMDWNVWAWGDNSKGQLGIGLVSYPVYTPLILRNIKAQYVQAGLNATAMIALGEI